MKKSLSLLSLSALVSLSQMSHAVELSVTITNITPDQGTLYVRIYDTKSKWLSTEKEGPHHTETVALSAHKGATEFTKTFDLPAGKYAVTATQDLNNNGTMDRNWMGIPTEPTGSTGDGTKKKGPPAFEQCVFELTEAAQQTVALIQY